MRVESMIAVTANRNGGTFFGGFVALAAVATLLLAPAAAHAADPGGSGSGGKSPAVTFESIPGSTAKRIILTAKAAERLGIETGEVSEELVVRKQMIGGLVIPPVEYQREREVADVGFGGFGQATDAWVRLPIAAPAAPPVTDETWVLVTLSQAEWDRLAKDAPARIRPLATRDNLEKEVLAWLPGTPPLEDIKRSMLTQYYVIRGNDHGLPLHQRVRVELKLSGSDETRKVVPYSAVYYGANGTAWVYVNPAPLVFERQRIEVEHIAGGLAVLSDGPPVGTPVVTVGAPLLYGAEILGK